MPQIPFPEPQPDRNPITLDQYHEYTPDKLELLNGYYGFAYQDMTGFHLAILTNMGLRKAVSHVPIAKWLAAFQEVAFQNPKLNEALRDRLVRGIEELNAIAECLESR
jgi:hypothetical protein